MPGVSNRISLIRRRGLGYPIGFSAGVDTSHIAAKGLRFSGIAAPAGLQFINLLNGKKGTVTSTFTSSIHGIIGRQITSTGTGQVAFSGNAATGVSSLTIGAIILGMAAATNGIIFNTTSAATAAPFIWQSPTTNNLAVTSGSGTINIDSGLGLVAGIPYFIGISFSSLTTTVKFVITNLLTGQIRTASIANTLAATASNGTYCVAGDGLADGSTGVVAAVMFSTAGISLPALLQWATDPWSFWYPTSQGAIAFDPAFAKAPSGGAAIIVPWPLLRGRRVM